MDYKTFLGALATLLALISYVPYFRDIAAGRTKPHVFSWLIWAILTAIGFAGQIVGGGGSGAWVTGFAALVSFIIFLTALRKGEKSIVLVDWLSLVGAGLALVLWWVTEGPLLAVILITIIDTLGFVPTFRKSFYKPDEETVSTFALSGIKYIPAIMALRTYSLVTWLYPASLLFFNLALTAMLVIRKKQLRQKQRVAFYPMEQFSAKARVAFGEHKARILQALPHALIEHIGSTAIPGSLTKGDLDIQVRVSAEQFSKAIEVLKTIYQIHQPENWTPTFASFKSTSTQPIPVGIQLTVIGSEDDVFQKARDAIRNNPEVLKEYNDMKRRFQGKSMTDYQAAKADFFEKVLLVRIETRKP